MASDLTAHSGVKLRNRPSAPELSVVIPTFNREEILRSCLTALAGQSISPERYEVIVVDDGSSDGTEDLCRSFPHPYRFEYVRQANAGAGAARKAGVEHSNAEYLVFLNDDTIASPSLLIEHLRAHRADPHEKWAVLGDIRYPDAARERALSYYMGTTWPQARMQAGALYGFMAFMTCNLSVERRAVLEVGSFDPTFRIAEDTELGLRLEQAGYRVFYHPQAWVWHDHVTVTLDDLIGRARSYGCFYLRLARKHERFSRMVSEGPPFCDSIGPSGPLDRGAAQNIRAFMGRRSSRVRDAVTELQGYENLDFRALLEQPEAERGAAAQVMTLFREKVPLIQLFYFYEGLLEGLEESTGWPASDTSRDHH
jgi:GT2 family glycosyltransferase